MANPGMLPKTSGTEELKPSARENVKKFLTFDRLLSII